MKNFFYYANLILCIGTAVAWIIQPMVGAMAFLVLGAFQIINAVIYLVQFRTLGSTTKKMFRIYGLFLLILIVAAIATIISANQNTVLNRSAGILLMVGSGAAAIFFTYVTYLAKKEVSSKFADIEDEILDSDLVL